MQENANFLLFRGSQGSQREENPQTFVSILFKQ